MSQPEPNDDNKGSMTPLAKAGAYTGLAFVTPISGWVCFKLGEWLAPKFGLPWLPMLGMIVGCAAGMYETFKQAMRIEGFDKKK